MIQNQYQSLNQSLGALGLKEIAYVRKTALADKMIFVVHGADGIPVAIHRSLAGAVELAQSRALKLVSRH